jgi:hypothetical protein
MLFMSRGTQKALQQRFLTFVQSTFGFTVTYDALYLSRCLRSPSGVHLPGPADDVLPVFWLLLTWCCCSHVTRVLVTCHAFGTASY